MTGYERCLPIYLLLDCSESMAGDAFTAMNQGLNTMIGELKTDPMALDLAALSVITFASSARQLSPLTELVRFNIPKLVMGSGTSLGAALELLEKSMAKEVRTASSENKGDYKPLVFILTDGEPTDRWEHIADRFNQKITGKTANIIAVACGPDAAVTKLQKITSTVVVMKNMDEVSFSEFFKWVSASVSTASQGLESSGERGVALPDLPKERLEVVREGVEDSEATSDRYMFLHIKCVKDGAFYIARYEKIMKAGPMGGQTLYKGTQSHPVQDFDFGSDSKGEGMKVNINKLLEPPPCPYCGNAIMAICECGRIHCAPAFQGMTTLTCPWCKVTGTYGAAGNLDIGRGRG